MSGHTITHGIPPTVEPAVRKREAPFSQGRAARELGLRRSEFELGVNLGHIRALPGEGGGGRRVARSEIERLRAQEGFPESLRRRVTAVGTREGAQLMQVTAARFTRLARLGLVVPVTFRLNRYRTLVWLYPAREVGEFAADPRNASVLTRPLPEGLRDQLDAGLDLRPRNWRGRYLGFLLRQAGDPWEQAAAVASLLDPLDISDIVPDPCERAHLNRLLTRPPAHGTPGSPAAHLTERITTAEDADEIDWLRADLARAVDEARAHRPAPRPAPQRTDRPAIRAQQPHPTGGCVQSQRLGPYHRPGQPEPTGQSGLPRLPRPERPRRFGHRGRTHRLLDRLFRREARGTSRPPVSGPGPVRSGGRAAYTARNRPSWTTDTSSRPSRS